MIMINNSMEILTALNKDINGNKNIFDQYLIFNSFINNSVILVAFLSQKNKPGTILG